MPGPELGARKCLPEWSRSRVSAHCYLHHLQAQPNSPAPISRIVDGDTFDVAGETIRLCGVDAPEHGDNGFAEAIVALSEITTKRSVRCLQVGGGTVCDGRSRSTNNGRVVAQCFVGEQDLAAELMRRGVVCDWVRFSGGHYSRDGQGRRCP